MDKSLLKIEPDKVEIGKNRIASSILTLALIRNDISDLVYFHDLLIKNIPKNVKSGDLNPELGQFSGRQIYILRLVLSHIYEILKFFRERRSEIDNDEFLQSLIKKLSVTDQLLWSDFLSLSIDTNHKSTKFTKDTIKLIKLSERARNDVTYHYYNSANHLRNGFREAFLSNQPLPNSEFALVTELSNVNKDRSYYIDLSIQKYLENTGLLGMDLFKFESEHIVDILAELHRIISKILSSYHTDISK